MRSARRTSRGFTLLEVIGAIAVLAIGFAVLLEATGASLALTRKAAVRTDVAAWARSKLDSAFVMQPPQPGVTHGQFDRRYHWQLAVTPWHPPAPRKGTHQAPYRDALQLYQLDLTVSWGAPGRVRHAHFRTLRVAAPSPESRR